MACSGREQPQLTLTQLESIVDLFPLPAWVHSEGTILCANDLARKLLGARSTSDLVGISVVDLNVEEDRPRIQRTVRDTHSTGQELTAREETLLRLDGGLVEVELSARSLYCDGRHARIVTAVDLTHRKLEQGTAARMVAMLQSADLAILSVTTTGTIEVWNPGAERLFGYTAAEALKRPLSIIVPPDRGDEYVHELEQIRQGVGVSAQDTERQHKDGSLVPVLRSLAPIQNGRSEVTGAVATFRHIGERKHAEEALRESEARYRALGETIPQLVYAADRFGCAFHFNNRWFSYTGMTDQESSGFGWLSAVHPEDRPATAEACIKAVQSGRPFTIENRLRRGKDGMFRWHLVQSQPALDDTGHIWRWYAVYTDIHDQKLTAEVLRRNNEDLKQFAYAASHDLQEPLRMVVSYTQLLERRFPEELDEDARKFVAYAVEGASRMEQLLKGLSEYWQASEHGSPALTDVDLNKVLQRVQMNLQTQIDSHGAIVLSSGLPIVRAACTPMVQLLQNLIGNAIKYRHPDRAPEIQIVPRDLGATWLISVVDNGVGIEPEYRDQVFKIFKRLHGRDIPGTGIGLALCQRIVERYGGALLLQSTPGEGSTFSFTIPR